MDGASKFVRGDAIAGIIITLVNVVGGFVIGVFSYEMDIAEAAEVFTKLTIGDGLVSQVPAFLISLAAGLLVTRSTQRSDLPVEFLTQILNNPRTLAVAGARILLVPAAFTVATTRDHWEVLLRARAIENQCFVVAANQIGEHEPGLRSGGRSMIVDPWGIVIAQATDQETVITADLDTARQDDIRRRLPALAGRRPGAYALREEHLA